MMKLLHTSDWHLGRTLHGARRYDEFLALFDWLIKLIDNENIDILVVAGDIFDSTAPSNRAQQLYYSFLGRLLKSVCQHIVIVAGNHDSPALLDAPKDILSALNVVVVGTITSDPTDEVFELQNQSGDVIAIICAVPYLRDRDLRRAEAGESFEDKDRKLVAGMRNHYAHVVTIAEERRRKLGKDIPIIATGHLFASGGKIVADDGVRELYVGNLAGISSDIFSPAIDYVALGHLHIAQISGGKETIRYSGSPIAMGFGESEQVKKVVLCEFNGRDSNIREISIPRFHELKRIKGNMEEIISEIDMLKRDDSEAWLEIECTEYQSPVVLKEAVDATLSGSKMLKLLLKNSAFLELAQAGMAEEIELSELTTEDVFKKCLESSDIPEEKQSDLLMTYNEALRSYYEQDKE